MAKKILVTGDVLKDVHIYQGYRNYPRSTSTPATKKCEERGGSFLSFSILEQLKSTKKEEPFFSFDDGALSLKGLEKQIGEEGSPAFIGRRLQHMNFTASTRLDFDPKNENEQAGLTLLNNGQHFDLLVKKSGKNRIVYVELEFGSITYRSKEFILKPGPVNLRVTGETETFLFSFSQGGEYMPVEKVDSRFLSTETVGWFTGVYVGLYATGKGEECKELAEYDYFEYNGK